MEIDKEDEQLMHDEGSMKYETLDGGKKDDEGKLRYDLIPPIPLQELARVYTIGAKKYGDYNWQNGIAYSRIIAALLRHLYKWILGEEYDPDGQHHLDSVAWCAFALRYFVYYQQDYTGYDDRKI